MNDLSNAEDSPLPAGSRRPFGFALIGSLLILIAATGLSTWAWFQVGPDARIPIHWNVKGEPDGYAGRMGLWYLVFGIAGITALLAVVPSIEPRRGHLLRSSRAYQGVWLATIGFLGLLHAVTVLIALGHNVSINRWMCIGLGLLFAIIGNYLGKTRSNFVFGIRTPWTLSSELSWRRTHRLGGRLFLAFGVVLFVFGVFDVTGHALFWMLLGGVIVLIAATFIYSYVVWRNDPDRRAGPSPADDCEKDA